MACIIKITVCGDVTPCVSVFRYHCYKKKYVTGDRFYVRGCSSLVCKVLWLMKVTATERILIMFSIVSPYKKLQIMQVETV
jgi:hypothetical protein